MEARRCHPRQRTVAPGGRSFFLLRSPPKQATAMIACWMVRDFSGASFDGKPWSEQRVRISILASALAAGALEAARLTGAIQKRRPPPGPRAEPSTWSAAQRFAAGTPRRGNRTGGSCDTLRGTIGDDTTP